MNEGLRPVGWALRSYVDELDIDNSLPSFRGVHIHHIGILLLRVVYWSGLNLNLYGSMHTFGRMSSSSPGRMEVGPVTNTVMMLTGMR